MISDFLSPTGICWILCAAGIIFACITLIWLLAPMRKVGNYYKLKQQIFAPSEEEEPEDDITVTYADHGIECVSMEEELQNPKASVIVYSITNDDQTLDYLEALTTQDYSDYEIILVMDSSYDNCTIFAEKCALRFPGVYVTFIPTGSHNLSRRKLALTLGMKAAKGEVAITTISNAAIPSSSWLSEIMVPFVNHPDTEVVLGYSRLDYAEMHSIWRWRREFDDMLTNSQWIGYALKGNPYRGDGYNLAFRRSLFFEHKGYSKTIHLHSGDDDLFISEIANRDNTRIVLESSSILTTYWGKSTTRTWRERKEQYRFTSNWLKRSPFIRLGATMLMQWLVSILLIIPAVYSLLTALYANSVVIWHILPAISAIALIAFWQLEIIIYRRAALVMGATRLWWAIPIFWLWQPISDMLFNLNHQSSSVKNFTWQRK